MLAVTLTLGWKIGLTIIIAVVGVVAFIVALFDAAAPTFETGGGSAKGPLIVLLLDAAAIVAIWILT